MGAWGTSIFADDTAADVRDDYRDLIADGIADAEAMERLQEEHLGRVPELRSLIEPVFWLALALTQWKLGRLNAAVRERAIEIIDSGKDLERWRALDASPAELRKRGMVLTRLRRQLLSPQRSRVKLRPRRRRLTAYQVGDVVQYTLGSGKYVLFRVTSIYSDRGGEYAVAEVLDWLGTKVPGRAELAALPARHRLKSVSGGSVSFARVQLEPLYGKGLDASGLVVVARGLAMPQVESEHFSAWPWEYYERNLAEEFGLK